MKIFTNFLFYLDPIDCDIDSCHLAWLVRDSPRLMKCIYGAKCSNGNTFDQLDSDDYKSCPVFIRILILLLFHSIDWSTFSMQSTTNGTSRQLTIDYSFIIFLFVYFILRN